MKLMISGERRKEYQGSSEGFQVWDILKTNSQLYTTNRSAFHKKRARFIFVAFKIQKEVLTRIPSLRLDERSGHKSQENVLLTTINI